MPEHPAFGTTRLKWFHFYFLLAAFNLLTVSFSLYLSHQLVITQQKTVEGNLEWVTRLTICDLLAKQAGEVHTPAGSVQQPGDATAKSEQYNVTLATNQKGWLGNGIDDIYEQRVLIQPQTKFAKAGDYHFTLEQVMREDPLLHVLSAGLRIEKIK